PKEPCKSLRQLVVFPLKRLVQDLVGSRIERFHPTLIAGADQDRDPAVDISFVAPLPKCHLFHALSHAPLFADFTNGGFVSGGHCPIPLGVAQAASVCAICFQGMCELPHTRERELRPVTPLPPYLHLTPFESEHIMNYVHASFLPWGSTD